MLPTLATPTNAFIEFKKSDVERSIPERFQQQVARYPGRMAIKTRRHEFTYRTLDETANRVARAILAEGEGEAAQIALLLENDAPIVAAILGVLKAGKIYVPLDPTLPRARITYMLEDSHAGVIVTNEKNATLAREVAQTQRVINMDQLDLGLSTENLDLATSPDAFAWIMYTSGSTGQPKGVAQTHRNVLHFVMNYTNGLHISPDDRITTLFSCHVNAGAHDIFSALLNGASLVPLDVKGEGVASVATWLIQRKATIYSSAPTVFRRFGETLTGERFPHLRLIKLMAEPVYRRDVELYKKYFSPGCLLVNRLGSTETGTIRWYFIDKETQISGNAIPVGYPVQDNQILLLNNAGDEVGFDEIGEIAVRSRYLSPGYWRRPDLTQMAFLPDPQGGDERVYRTGDLGRMLGDECLLHLGRKDFQVKIRGHRIEVDEIEAALLEIPAIKEAVVVAREDRTGEHRLVAYLVSKGGTLPSVTRLRHTLATRLPDYMIPSAFVTLDALPLAPNGKVHRPALPPPDTARPEVETTFVPPGTPVEKILAKIWADLLDLEQVGIHDNFLELGGHSLLAMQVVARVFDTFRVEIPLQSLLETPTVASMAIVIVEHLVRNADRGAMDRMVAEVEGLSEEEARRLLAEET